MLVALILSTGHPVWLLLIVATAGNVLGSVLNWTMGRFVNRLSDGRWFPFSQRQMAKATRWFARWGHWSLPGPWLPLIGDPLTLAVGVLREPLWRFVLIVTFGKGGRYLVLAWITLNLAA